MIFVAPALPGNTLKTLWTALNRVRIEQKLLPLSYSGLAIMVSEPNPTIPGEAVPCSKDIVAQIMSERYTASTRDAFASRIHTIIKVNFSDLNAIHVYYQSGGTPCPQPTKKPSVQRVTKTITRLVRVSPEGYLKFRNRFYFAGSTFAGNRVTVSPVKNDTKDFAIKISGDGNRKTCHAINPYNNQLGYVAQ